MALDPKKLTINYSSLSKLPAQVRNNALNSGLLDNYLDVLSPTELANLFPNYYQREAVIPSGFQKAMSGEGGAPSGGEGIPSAIPSSTGGGNQRPVSSTPQVEPNDPLMEFFREHGVRRTPSRTTTTTVAAKSETDKAIADFASRWGINPIAAFGTFQIESKLRPTATNGGYHGVFQLGTEQVGPRSKDAGLGELTPAQFRRLSVTDQLKVMDEYYKFWGVEQGFFTGDEKTDSAKMWALQLAPSRAKKIDYSNPNAVISKTNQAKVISARRGLVTVGSSSSGAVIAGSKVLSEINQQDSSTYKSGVSAGFFGGLGSNRFNTMSGHARRAKKAGHNVFTSTTDLAGYTKKEAENMARQIIESGDSNVVLNGHSAGGKYAVLVGNELRRQGYTGKLTLNLADPAQYSNLSFTSNLPENSTINVAISSATDLPLSNVPARFLNSDPTRGIVVNKVNVGGTHGGLAGTSEFEQMMATSLGTTKTEIPLPEEILITPETKQFMDSLTEEQKKVIENSSMSKDQLLSSIQHGINEGKITYDQFGEYLKSTKPRPTATEIKGAIDSQQDPYEFWEARNPRGAILQYGSRRVSRELLTTAMMSAQKFEAEHPGKRVEIYGKKGGIRLGSGTSMHKQDGAIDLAIFEVDRDGNYIDMGGSHKNYPNIPIHKGGKKGSAAAAHLYDRLNEDIELARVYKHSVEGDTNYGYGTRIGTYFGDVTYDQMHTDIKAKLNELGISDQVNPKTGSVAYGMTENWLRNYGIDPSSPEGQELLTGVAEKYGGTKEGIIQASIEAYGPQQQEELSDINQPDLPTQETTEQNSAVPDVKPEPKPEPKPESETEIPKALGTGDQPIQVGTPDTGKAVLTTEKGETYQIGENQAEKIHIESKYNPDMISSKMDIDTTSENPVVNNNGEKYKPTTQPMQKSQEIDFLPSSMGKESSWSLSQMKHIQNSKFSASGFSGHLNYGSKNQSY